MARINIEDSLFKDHRFFQLAIKTGSMQNALGAIVWAFIIAQKHFLNEANYRKIPIEEWKKQNCSDLLIEVGLAQISEQGVSVSGSEEQFSWLLQRVEAGRIGGLSSRAINARLSDDEKIKRNKARKKVANAIQRGRLQKPTNCEHCGKAGLIEAHHSDYNKPFDVSWVCKKCHHIIHDSLVDHENEQDKRSLTSVKRVEAVANPHISYLLSHSLIRSNNDDVNAKTNSSSLFELRMKFQAWESFLKQNNIYETRLGHGLDKISERFESVDKLESFVTEVLSSPKSKAMNHIELRKYIKGAIANEAGLVKNT